MHKPCQIVNSGGTVYSLSFPKPPNIIPVGITIFHEQFICYHERDIWQSLFYLADTCGYVDNNNNDNNNYVSGLESFKMAYDSPPRRVISYTDQTTAVSGNTMPLLEPFQRWSDGKSPSNQHPYLPIKRGTITRGCQPQIVRRIDTQKEREAFVVRLLRRPWTENKMPCMPMFISREQLHFYMNDGEVSSVLLWSHDLHTIEMFNPKIFKMFLCKSHFG